MVTTKGRYIVGREVMILMGMPVHKLKLRSCSESVTCPAVVFEQSTPLASCTVNGSSVHKALLFPRYCTVLAETPWLFVQYYRSCLQVLAPVCLKGCPQTGLLSLVKLLCKQFGALICWN